MLILDSIEAARVWRASVRQDHRVGLVPTMGALHAGHGRCITSCSATCDVTVVSIFVNRSQFGDPNDFDSYPRTWNEDLTLAQQAGADVVFAPREAEMAPLMAASPRHAGPLASLWEGRHRPGHFDAVVTVVNQLFSIVRPNRARFGEKDRQQLAVIRTWSTIEWPSIVIDAEPTVREADGLAMSRAVHDLIASLNGSISAEHGIGRLKRDELAWRKSPVEMEMMRAVKRALDPDGRMNPGRLL